jgi:hypothetical protein
MYTTSYQLAIISGVVSIEGIEVTAYTKTDTCTFLWFNLLCHQ